ncbi:CoA ester lyase [Sphingomonas sp.]|uniref:HpcH/HpaI aldolase/citrate lyase family protein n=1 Tax=Sphingomonas sp. TaxID=28214 RepID=UPI001B128E52|nr:CoA ester lyase [Sphingomonas sp.]MBO9711821.1 CoA ester lyase [Sphingomonas sp.]
MSTLNRLAPRTALFMPASNPRAIEKARDLDVDLVILDLEDAVRADAKDSARAAALDAVAEPFGASLSAIRLNAIGTPWHQADVAAVAESACDYAVLPKTESAEDARRIAAATGKPLLVMIETPVGLVAATDIARTPGVAGLITGSNDLRAELGIPPVAGRAGLALALQMIVLAARVGGVWAIDGVFNALDDGQGFAKECRHGRSLGFDGKSLIHPYQIAIATKEFGPTEQELAEARELIAAFTGGAERFRDRMIEVMHVDQARALLARTGEETEA